MVFIHTPGDSTCLLSCCHQVVLSFVSAGKSDHLEHRYPPSGLAHYLFSRGGILVLSDGGGWKNIIMFDVWEVIRSRVNVWCYILWSDGLMDGRTNG